MSRFSRMLSLFAVPVLLAACSSGGTDTPLSPTAPRRDGGSVLLGGNAVPTDSSQTGTSTSTSSGDGTDLNPADGPDATNRGGSVLLGGN
jgi:hypothetical protein